MLSTSLPAERRPCMHLPMLAHVPFVVFMLMKHASDHANDCCALLLYVAQAYKSILQLHFDSTLAQMHL